MAELSAAREAVIRHMLMKALRGPSPVRVDSRDEATMAVVRQMENEWLVGVRTYANLDEGHINYVMPTPKFEELYMRPPQPIKFEPIKPVEFDLKSLPTPKPYPKGLPGEPLL